MCVQARNARQAEDHLLQLSLRHGGGHLNKQWASNYADTPGFVYVIVGRIIGPDYAPGPAYPPHMAHAQQECCSIM